MAHALALIEEHHLGPDGVEGPEVEPLGVVGTRGPHGRHPHIGYEIPILLLRFLGRAVLWGAPKDLWAA